MSKLSWDLVGERVGETGVKQGVLYPWNGTAFQPGVAWNGLISVSESPTGAEANPFYADDIKYIEIMSAEEFAGSVSAYTYPDEFKSCIGEVDLATGVSVSQQNRSLFGMSYKTTLVNDTDGLEYGYKIHLVYNAKASVSEAEHSTINDSPELVEFSWDFTTTPIDVPNLKPSSHIIIDSTKLTTPADKEKLETLETALYGDVDSEPYLPLPSELVTIFA